VFIRRGGSADDPWLNEKLWVFTIGAIVAMLGMLLDNLWVMGGAALILAGGVALRFVPRGDEGQRDGGGRRTDIDLDADDPSDPFSGPDHDEDR